MERRYGEPSKTRNDSGAEFNRGGVAGALMVHVVVVLGGYSALCKALHKADYAKSLIM
jgi:hypothetical protein